MSVEEDAAVAARAKTEALMSDVLACDRTERAESEGPLRGFVGCSCAHTMANMFYGLLLRLYYAEREAALSVPEIHELVAKHARE